MDNLNNKFVDVPEDSPDFLQGIRQTPYYAQTPNTTNVDVAFTPYNHFTSIVPAQTDLNYEEPSYDQPIKENPSFVDTFTAAAHDQNVTYHFLRAGFERAYRPDQTPDENFNPYNYQAAFINIKPENYSYLLHANNETDLFNRLHYVNEKQKEQDDVENGGWTSYLSGSALGIVTDPFSYIPVTAGLKYAKPSSAILSSLGKAALPATAYGTLSSLGEQLDNINGNTHDFLIDSMTRSLFGTILYGAGDALTEQGLLKSQLWNLRKFSNDYLSGVGFRVKADEKGLVTGIEAFDMMNEPKNAMKVKIAQDRADSAMAKTGIFRVPYLGEAATKFLGNRVFGTPMIRLLNSPYKMVSYIADRAVDHGIITERLRNNIPTPNKFMTLMGQTHAEMTALSAQLNGLYLERNGFNVNNYVKQKLTEAKIYSSDKANEFLAKDMSRKSFTSREEFNNEIEQVLIHDQPSAHASVNKAAAMYRETMDKYWLNFRKANNLSEDWLPPRTAEGYLMRVYDTAFLNVNEKKFVDVISNHLKETDDLIISANKPIEDLQNKLQSLTKQKESLITSINVPDKEHKKIANEIISVKAKIKAERNRLSNEIRENPDYNLLAHDWNALSADEARELRSITKRRDIAQKEVDAQKEVIRKIKEEASTRKEAAMKAKSDRTAKKNKYKSDVGTLMLDKEEAHLKKLEEELEEETAKLQEDAYEGRINSRFYTKVPDSNILKFKDTNDLLRFRETYHHSIDGEVLSEESAHLKRIEHAKAYYNTIMNNTAEDTINQIMNHVINPTPESHFKSRTLMVPDKLLYDNNFMAKDTFSKVSNYVTWLARRTHLKNVFSEADLHEGFKPLLNELHNENEVYRSGLNKKLEDLRKEIQKNNLSENEIKSLNKKIKKAEYALNKQTKQFNQAKKDIQFIYDKMMGISPLSTTAKAVESSIKSATVAANLGFLPYTMVTDLSAIGLQMGVIPFLKDGIYPLITSLAGILKTKDSEAFRRSLGSLNLGLQHVLSGTAERNNGLTTNPYLNLGKIPTALKDIAHFASNISFANMIDNFLQRIGVATAQSEFMRIMHAYKNGTALPRELQFLARYGLDADEWADRFIDAYKASKGFKTKLNGYQSKFWEWQDFEAANKMADASYRAIKDSVISANFLDAPMWTDTNGFLGMFASIIKGFSGWAYGSLNRYVMPTLQAPDANRLMGVMLMLGAGALVSPTRRMAKGENAYPDNMTSTEWAYEVISDSAYFSFFTQLLNEANLLSGNELMGNLKNDKYRDRSRTGFLGPAWSDYNRAANFISALATNEMNENDALQFARMIPPFNSSWTWNMSQNVIKGLNLPKNRKIAALQKGT